MYSISNIQILFSFLGCFNLDPNRVLDVILESFESHPENGDLFIPLLQAYMPNGDVICEVLGYKYVHFSETKTPESLYRVTALLLQSGVIQLNEIYSWVSILIINVCLHISIMNLFVFHS